MTNHDETERWRLEALADKLQRQNDQLRDIVRASQYLIDIINYQHNATGGVVLVVDDKKTYSPHVLVS